MTRGRAQRRAESAKRKVRVRRRLNQEHAALRFAYDRSQDPVAVGRRARTPQLCSCLGCGNARRHLGPTRQERRAGDAEKHACPVRAAERDHG